MMRFRLRTLLIILAIAPIFIAAVAYVVARCIGPFVVTTEWK
jgi:hypothetical protein